uniref:Uncharacterized protein LOC8267302 n=1 Tax=Rhizophora mucronata TaxID=61149 RepID=A0A2P2L4J3_RHIMU
MHFQISQSRNCCKMTIKFYRWSRLRQTIKFKIEFVRLQTPKS